jgi:hypothetical protein
VYVHRLNFLHVAGNLSWNRDQSIELEKKCLELSILLASSLLFWLFCPSSDFAKLTKVGI